MTTKEAIDHLREALKDPDYREGWQANIAMAFKDQWALYGPRIPAATSDLIHDIANDAAIAFLEQIAPTREMPDVPGMMAVALTHSIAQGGRGARSGSSERSEESGTPAAPGAEGMRPKENEQGPITDPLK